MTLSLVVNARFRKQQLTGVQRFAGEVINVLNDDARLEIDEALPSERFGSGLQAHAWEQFALPRSIGKSVLFSPANTGPLAIKRQLVVIHDAAVWDQPDGFTSKFINFYQWLLPRLAKRCRIATVSQFSRERLAHYLKIPVESIEVFGNAVASEFQPGQQTQDARDPFLLCVGSLDPRKNFQRLIQAWEVVCQRNFVDPETKLKIVGSCNPRTFQSLGVLQDNDRVEWTGRVSDADLIQLYQSAQGFVFPSLYEGFGIPPLEAMACGCPVAMSQETSLPEVGGKRFDLDQPGSTGSALYFDPLNVEEISRRIEQLLSLTEDQKQLLRKNAQCQAATFSWQAVGQNVGDAICDAFD
jgi:glycosyltransferase involved in cell wall biosynthesis